MCTGEVVASDEIPERLSIYGYFDLALDFFNIGTLESS
jgi:hypothetical protein